MARVAVLDANVLWPQYLRDTLLRAAIFDMYRGAWTDRILNEMRNSLLRQGRIAEEQIDRTLALMRGSFSHFMVEGYEDLISAMTNDEKDRHVLAAAVCTGADTIVTSNGVDFPPSSRERYGIDVDTPDEFLTDLWLMDSNRMARMLVNMAAGFKRPPLTAQQLVGDVLVKHAPVFVDTVLASDDLEAALRAEQEGIPLPQCRFL